METLNKNNGDASQPAIDIERKELFPEEEGDIVNTMDVTRKIYAIQLVEKLIDQYELQDQESRQFYAGKKAGCEKRIEFIKRNIQGFLELYKLKNVQTPYGTAYQREICTKHWPSDDILVAWALVYKPDAIRTKREPDKKLISEHINATGDAPDGY